MIKRNTRINKKKEPLYIFLHVMKTGGTTIREHIVKNFRKEKYLFLYANIRPFLREKEDIRKYIRALTREQKGKLKIIFGHCSYYGLDKLFPDREVRYIAFLRNPANKIISQYNFQRANLDKKVNLKRSREVILINGKILPFGRKWFQQNKVFLENHMTKFFFLHPAYGSQPINENTLKKVKKMLDRFYFVGITENPEDFSFIYSELGIERFVDDANVSEKDYAEGDYQKNKELILSKNKYDLELYDYAKKLNKRFKKQSKASLLMVYSMKIKKLLFHTLRVDERYQSAKNSLYRQSAKLRKKSNLYAKFVDVVKYGR